MEMARRLSTRMITFERVLRTRRHPILFEALLEMLHIHSTLPKM
jgi:hypothetical protein